MFSAGVASCVPGTTPPKRSLSAAGIGPASPVVFNGVCGASATIGVAPACAGVSEPGPGVGGNGAAASGAFLPNATPNALWIAPPPIPPLRPASIKRVKFSGVKNSLFSSTKLTAAALVISWRASVAPSVRTPLPSSLAPRAYHAPTISLFVRPLPLAERSKLSGVIASNTALKPPDAKAGSSCS